MIATLREISCWRVIATRIPSADLFDGIADFGEWEAVAEIETLWNERSRGPLSHLATIPKQERAYGPGSSYLMAPFAYRARGRFGDGTFGVLYAGLDERTALVEVAYHRGRFLRDSANPKETMDYQVLGLGFGGEVEDLRGLQSEFAQVYDPDSWLGGQQVGAVARSQGLDGIAYSSVRNRGGECVAGFKPNAFHDCRHLRRVQFFWDGAQLHGPAGLWA